MLTVLLLSPAGDRCCGCRWSSLAVVLLTVFALGLALACPSRYVYFRDTSYLMAIVLQFWFYLTPVVYPATLVDDAVGAGRADRRSASRARRPPLRAQPDGAVPRRCSGRCCTTTACPTGTTGVGCLCRPALALVVGVCVFRRFSGRLAEEL